MRRPRGMQPLPDLIRGANHRAVRHERVASGPARASRKILQGRVSWALQGIPLEPESK